MKFKSRKKMRKIVGKKANVFFSMFMVLLIIVELSTLAYISAKRANGVNLEIGTIQSNIELIKSQIRAEEYFVSETAENIKQDAVFNTYDSIARDLNYIEEYQLNKILDNIILGRDGVGNSENDVLLSLKQNNCNYRSGYLVIRDYEDMGCMESYTDIILYFDLEFSKYLQMYYSKNTKNDLRDSFEYGLDYKNGDLVLFGFSKDITKSINYASAAEFNMYTRINANDAIRSEIEH